MAQLGHFNLHLNLITVVPRICSKQLPFEILESDWVRYTHHIAARQYLEKANIGQN